MTVSTTQVRVSYTGDGVSVNFATSFAFYASTDLLVVQDGVTKTLAADYTVTGGNGALGTVVMNVAPAVGINLQVILNPPLTQTVALVDGTAFPAATLNQQADRGVQIALRLNDKISRSVQVADGTDVNPNLTLPNVAARAGKFFGFGASGEPIASVGTGNDSALRTDLAAGLSALVDSNSVSFKANAAETAAVVTPTLFYINRYKDVPVERYGVVVGAGGDATANTAAMQRAINVAAAVSNTGGVVLMPQGTIRVLANSLTAGANSVNFQGSGKANTFLQAIGATADQPILQLLGIAGQRAEIFVRGFALASDNNLARGITATYIINSVFDDLYFYQLKNGYVADTCYGVGFRNNNAYLVTGDCYRLGINCNNQSFNKVRCVGTNGITISSEASAISISGSDFEGILVGGAAITIGPATTRQVHAVGIRENYFENINGVAIYANGVDANSILGLVVEGNYITGGFAAYGNAGAVNGVYLNNVNGFVFDANEFEDWQTNGFLLGTHKNGRVVNNTNGRNAIPNLSSATFDKSVYVANNWAGPQQIYLPTTLEFALTYGVTVASDASLGRTLIVTATNGVAFTMSNPTNGFTGQQVTWRIKNTSGGALGVITWAATFHLGAAWVSPATGANRSITFEYDGTNWIELYRTSADVSN